VVCIFSAVVAVQGLESIINLAAPILLFLYPGALVVVVLAFFDRLISSDRVVKWACAGALLGGLCDVLGILASIRLPLQSYGCRLQLP
jgi:LIVCS family branched-chain amino acid:cation transporter